MSSTFVVLYCSHCGYEEEVHYKEIERRSLKCPQCGHFIDYEQSSYNDFEDDWDDILDSLPDNF